MDLGADWPIAILATQDVACGVRLWRTSGQRRATLVVKATFAIVDGGPMRLVGPEPIVVNDQHAAGNPSASVVVPSDLAPYLPRADVLLSGHAQAPSGAPQTELEVRLNVTGQRAMVDKVVTVHGERVMLDDGSASAAVPFTRVPLLYERTARGSGPHENPVGMMPTAGSSLPNIVDPSDPNEPAGFGAIAATWPTRRRLLRQLDPAVMDAPIPEVPEAFAWSYFHAAPPDQRCAFLEGNEWIVLDGLDPERRQIRTQLPGVRAEARLYDQTRGSDYVAFELVADTLYIDADRNLVCLSWRGNASLDQSAIENLTFLAGLEMPGRTIPWPENELPADAPKPAPAETASVAGPESAIPLVARARPGATRLEGGVSSPGSVEVSSPEPEVSARNFAEDVSSAQGVSMVGTPVAPDVHITRPSTEPPRPEVVPISQQPTIDLTGSLSDVDIDPSTRRRGADRERFGVTAPTPPSLLKELMTQAQSSRGPSNPSSPKTMASAGPLSDPAGSDARLPGPETMREPEPQFVDEETYQPGAEELARLVEDAEASSREEPSVPFPPESSTGDGMSHISGGSMRRARPPKTTRRGLGDPSPSHPAMAAAPSNPGVGARDDAQRVSEPATLPPPSPAARPVAPASVAVEPIAVAEQATPAGSVLDVTLSAARSPLAAAVGDAVLGSPERPTVAGRSLPPRDEVLRCITFDLAIRDLDLDGVDLAGLDLSSRVFEGSRLTGANLRGANLRKAKLRNCVLDGAELSQANLEDADLTGASLQGAILSDARLTRARVDEARFDGAIGTNTSLDEASGVRAQFVGARFDCARFDGARLANADFTEAIIDGASFVGAELTEARFYEARGEAVSFVRGRFVGARLDAAVLRRGDFREAEATDTLWDQAELDQALFHGARLAGASFTQTSCREVVFDGADLSEARFNKAVLWGARFVNANVASTTFEGADLRGASLPPRPPSGLPPQG